MTIMSHQNISPVWETAVSQSRRFASGLQSREGQIATGVVGASSLLYLLRQCYINYKSWRALGPAGPPPNPIGWSIAWVLRILFSRETKSTTIYDEPWTDSYAGKLSEKEVGVNRTRFLPEEGLPQRAGTRPAIANFVVPHREEVPVLDMMFKQVCNLSGVRFE